MPLGKLSSPDYTKLYDPADVRKNGPLCLNAAKQALATCLGAFQYFLRVPDAVWQGSNSVDAAFLIGVERNLMSVIPPNVKFKAFDRNGSSLGFVLVNAATKVISLYDPGTGEDRLQHGGLWYEGVGDHQGKTIYARLDKTAIHALENGKNLTDAQLNVYEKSMKKGVIPSGSTGSDGIKFDNNTWVIKTTISIAQANLMDNTLSPMATPATSGTNIFLNFNQLVFRH